MANNYLFRYSPCSFSESIAKNKNTKEQTVSFENFGESITDKESYRLNLASQRGAMASNMGSSNVGSFMFEDGKYDIHKDFSYILRKDLSIVDIDNYTNILKRKLEEADEDLKLDIQNQISQLNQKKEEKLAKESDSDSTTE